VRVLTAIRNSGYQLPQKKITVNLAPGDLRKEGAAFDLAIALGVLGASGVLPPDHMPALAVGELALSGICFRFAASADRAGGEAPRIHLNDRPRAERA